MKILFALLLTVLLSPRAFTATVEQLLPWLAPNTLAFGTPFSDFTISHPSATELFPNERLAGGAFNGGVAEELSDGSAFIYGFADGRLASIDWVSNPSGRIAETLLAARNALIRVHGQPTVETAARVDVRGSIARIEREVYRPTIEKDYVICLMATSEGVEVALTNEAIARKHGVNTSRQTYEEAAKSISSVVQPNAKQSELVDYLAAERKKPEAPQPDAKPKPPNPQPPTPSTPFPAATPLPSKPVAKVAESPAPVVERESSAWPWVVGIAALIAIIVVALKRRA